MLTIQSPNEITEGGAVRVSLLLLSLNGEMLII